MRTKKVNVSLSVDNLAAFGVYVTCCNKRQWIGRYTLEPCEHWGCDVCDKPLVLRGNDGLFYFVGNQVFD